MSFAYHLQMDGHIERTNRNLAYMLIMHVGKIQQCWD